MRPRCLYFTELVHTRIKGDEHTQMIELVPDAGCPAEDLATLGRFHGVVTLTVVDAQGHPIEERPLRFVVPGESVQHAWAAFDEALEEAKRDALRPKVAPPRLVYPRHGA